MGRFNSDRGSDRKFGGGRKGGFGGGFGGRNSGKPNAMYRATCSDCGKSCEVPFKPTFGKPVYCNDCFRKDEGGSSFFDKRDSGRDSGRSGGFGEKRMHKTTCAECGNMCEVPFKPTGEKPVYCSDCFGANRGGGNFESKKTDQNKEQFDQLNAKLDRILKTLEIIQNKKEHVIEKKDVEKKDSPKKASKKKKKTT